MTKHTIRVGVEIPFPLRMRPEFDTLKILF